MKICLFVLAVIGCQTRCYSYDGLSGKHLTIVAVPWKPFLVWKCPNDEDWTEDWETDCPNGDNKIYGGILWELLMFMQQAKNFSFSFIGIEGDEWGGICYDANNCTGMIGRVNRHEADFALGNILQLESRDDSGYGLTSYGGYGFVTSYTILTVYYCNRSNLALFNRY